jgi:hypothetical protein
LGTSGKNRLLISRQAAPITTHISGRSTMRDERIAVAMSVLIALIMFRLNDDQNPVQG